MPRIKWEKTRKMHSDDSIVAVSYIDGLIVEIRKHGDENIKVFVDGESESIMLSNKVLETGITVGKHLKGFAVEYCIPDDGMTVFTIYEFYPVE